MWRTSRHVSFVTLPLMPPKMSYTDAMVVLTTVANEKEGITLVRGLLERRVIACGTLLPGARSLYRWEDKFADEQEVVILLKTRSAALESLRVAFSELHPYKVPELLAMPVNAGLDKYLHWITSETSLAIR
jgi:periplasmic divalent cation tolerance protein